MTAFVLAAALLLALAWWLLRSAWTAPPAQAAAAAHHSHPAQAALAVLREQLATLGAGPERDALRRRVLEEGAAPATWHEPQRGARSLRWITLAGLPLSVAALYAALGNPAALTADTAVPRQATAAAAEDTETLAPAALSAMLDSLAQSLQAAPADTTANAQGWAMLGRGYASMQRFDDAHRALARAVDLSPRDAQLLADHADVLAMVQGQRTDGEPERLLARALDIDPGNVKALALAGTAAYQRQDWAAARTLWQRAHDAAPDGSAFKAGIARSLAEVSAPAAAVAPAGPRAAAGALTGRVSLAPALLARAAATDTVFVFARAAGGPGMPLAIVRATVAQLPLDFVLDDGSAMSPQARLSGSPQVVVGARISRSGEAIAQPGDLHTLSAPLPNTSRGVQLVIDTALP